MRSVRNSIDQSGCGQIEMLRPHVHPEPLGESVHGRTCRHAVVKHESANFAAVVLAALVAVSRADHRHLVAEDPALGVDIGEPTEGRRVCAATR